MGQVHQGYPAWTTAGPVDAGALPVATPGPAGGCTGRFLYAACPAASTPRASRTSGIYRGLPGDAPGAEGRGNVTTSQSLRSGPGRRRGCPPHLPGPAGGYPGTYRSLPPQRGDTRQFSRVPLRSGPAGSPWVYRGLPGDAAGDPSGYTGHVGGCPSERKAGKT